MNARVGVLCLAFGARALAAQTVVVTVDVTQDRAPISPLIYGINYVTLNPFGTVSSGTISDLNASFVRNGGNLVRRDIHTHGNFLTDH